MASLLAPLALEKDSVLRGVLDVGCGILGGVIIHAPQVLVQPSLEE